jgi:heptosyltransferase III
MRIILSRTDSIGDVVLTLPMAGVLKQSFPGCTVIFLGRNYTRPVIEACEYVDQFCSWDDISGIPDEESRVRFLSELQADIIIHVFPVKAICRLAKQAGIPTRVATWRRSFTWFTCNRLLHIPRKNSNLHEAQLNLKMLAGVGIERVFTLEEIGGMYGLTSGRADRRTGGQADMGGDQLKIKNYELQEMSDVTRHVSPVTHYESPVTRHESRVTDKFTLLLHPKSKGSAREWGLENYSKLIDLLPADQFNIIVTGTKDEGALMHDFLEGHRDRISDMTGKLTLDELMKLIRSCDGMVAASTGPLHLAAAFGIRAVGLYAPMRPIFPQRWAPLGKNATFLVLEKTCSDCRKTMDCACIRSITPESVIEKLYHHAP